MYLYLLVSCLGGVAPSPAPPCCGCSVVAGKAWLKSAQLLLLLLLGSLESAVFVPPPPPSSPPGSLVQSEEAVSIGVCPERSSSVERSERQEITPA